VGVYIFISLDHQGLEYQQLTLLFIQSNQVFTSPQTKPISDPIIMAKGSCFCGACAIEYTGEIQAKVRSFLVSVPVGQRLALFLLADVVAPGPLPLQ